MQLRHVLNSIKFGFPLEVVRSYDGMSIHSRRHVIFAAKRNCSSTRTTVFRRKVNVKPFGKLYVESHWLPVQVRHSEIPENCVEFCVNAESVEKIPSWKLSGFDFGLTFHTELNENNATNVHIKNDAKSKDNLNLHKPWLYIDVPVQFDIYVQSFSNQDVTLSNLESSNIDCCLQYGKLLTRNIKCEHLNIRSTAGNVHCKGSVLGNVNIKTEGTGCIRADRLQGSVVCLRSDEGEINVNAIYAENSKISSRKASVSLANLHGNSRVSIYHGDLMIAGLDGGLSATVSRGNADIKISRLLPNAHAAVIANDGNIFLMLADDLVARLRLEGKDVEIEDVIQGTEITESDDGAIICEGCLNSAEFNKASLITAVAPMGTVTIEMQNWLPKFNLD